MKTLFYCSLFLLFLLYSAIPGYSQHYNFKHLGKADGLPSSYVYDAIEDEYGYMWFATRDGISRYDGKEFKRYDAREGFVDEGAYKIIKDKRNQLWFISLNYHLYRLKNDRLERRLNKKLIVSMEEDRLGMYAQTRSGEFLELSDTTILSQKQIGTSTNYYSKRLDKERIIFVEPYHSYYWNAGNVQALKIRKYVLNTTRVYRIPDGRIFICNLDGMYLFDKEKNSLHLFFPLNKTEIYCMYFDTAKNDIWFGTSTGAYRFKNSQIDADHLEVLFSQPISSIHKGRQGEFWFTSYGEGVFVGDLESLHYSKEDGLKVSEIEVLKKQGSYMYLISSTSNFSFIKDKKIENIPFQCNGSSRKIFQGADNYPIYFLSADKYWTFHNGKVIRAQSYIGSYYEPNIKEIKFIDPEGKIYFSAPGLCCYDSKRGFYNFFNKEDIAYTQKVSSILRKEYITNPTIKAIHGKEIFSLHDRGILRLNSAIGQQSYEYDTVYESQPNDLLFTRNGSIVVATKSKGVDIKINGVHHFYNTDKGLPGNSVKKIIYENGIIWGITSDNLFQLKLNRFDHVTKVNTYNVGHFNSIGEINDFVIDGEDIYIATNTGVGLFNRNTLRAASENIPLYIQGVKVNEDATGRTDSVVLPYDKNNLEIQYRALIYSNEKVEYRYTMGGAEDSWHITDKDNVRYTAMNPGVYHFILYAKAKNGKWGNSPAMIYIRIYPPFWYTWWFISICALLLVGILVFIIYRILKANKKQLEIKRKIVESELRAIRLHMNPHFIYNTLSSLQSYILLNKNEQANEYLAKFSRLIRLIMHYSSKREIPLADELAFLVRYIELEQVRFEDKFEVEFDIMENVNTINIFIPPLVIQPFVENAIKYGINNKEGKGHLYIGLFQKESFLQCIIEDDGIGREKAGEMKLKYKEQFESTGIQYTIDRLRLLSDRGESFHPVKIIDLYSNDHIACGTRVEILIPLIDTYTYDKRINN